MATIVTPLDGSDLARRALPLAAFLAQRAGAGIKLVEAIMPPSAADGMPALVTEIEDAVSGTLQDEARAIAARYGLQATAVARYHSPIGLILSEAQKPDATYVVMSTHGRTGLGRVVLGSVAEQVLRSSPVPVFLVPAAAPPNDAPALEHILVPLDGSALSESVLGPVAAFAAAVGARITLLRVYPAPRHAEVISRERMPFPGSEAVGPVSDEVPAQRTVIATLDEQANEARRQAEEYLQPLAAGLRERGVRANVAHAEGLADELIVSEAERLQVDLIALATHGRSGLDRLRHGSVTEAVLRRSRVPLMTFGREALAAMKQA